jgi:hypothetical protein
MDIFEFSERNLEDMVARVVRLQTTVTPGVMARLKYLAEAENRSIAYVANAAILVGLTAIEKDYNERYGPDVESPPF